MAINLDKMTDTQLAELIDQAKQLRQKKAEDAKLLLREKWEAEAKEAGLTVADVVGTATKPATKTKAKNPPNHRHPDDPSLTVYLTENGKTRGPKPPRWLAEFMDAGGKVEDLVEI